MAPSFPGTILQDSPRIYLSVISGRWLLKKTTPSWRNELPRSKLRGIEPPEFGGFQARQAAGNLPQVIKNPKKGFQRMVTERRAREIAAAVLDQKRTFPNAIVLDHYTANFDQNNFPNSLQGETVTQFELTKTLLLLAAERAKDFKLKTDVFQQFSSRSEAITRLVYRARPANLVSHGNESQFAN